MRDNRKEKTVKKYNDFLLEKENRGANCGFDPLFMPDILFDFQKHITEWAIKKGRCAVFADCGLGKTFIQLTWAKNICLKTKGKVLILTPIAVSYQTMNEAKKIDIQCGVNDNEKDIVITNYEKLHMFNPEDFQGVVCDESSILKSFNGVRKNDITQFMKKIPYRLLCTATAAPNDFTELGTSSEALGYMGYMDMLTKFFKNDSNTCSARRRFGEAPKWRLKGHAEIPFWRWCTSWSVACRKPSDIGFDNKKMTLPPLTENINIVESKKSRAGMLFNLPAKDLFEQREEKRLSMQERCEKVAELVNHDKPAIVWCHLNDEGKKLRELIPDAVEISGADKDERKEKKIIDFVEGRTRVLITKPKIGGFGLNFQHCAHIVYFVSHSYEQYYQAVRRCWRFGQKNNVVVDVVMSEGEQKVYDNLQYKSKKAAIMFDNLVKEMNNSLDIKTIKSSVKVEVPSWV